MSNDALHSVFCALVLLSFGVVVGDDADRWTVGCVYGGGRHGLPAREKGVGLMSFFW